MALLLRKQGVRRVRPLAGGLDGWSDGGFPVVAREVAGGDGDAEVVNAR